jgi:hypothetical protein
MKKTIVILVFGVLTALTLTGCPGKNGEVEPTHAPEAKAAPTAPSTPDDEGTRQKLNTSTKTPQTIQPAQAPSGPAQAPASPAQAPSAAPVGIH